MARVDSPITLLDFSEKLFLLALLRTIGTESKHVDLEDLQRKNLCGSRSLLSRFIQHLQQSGLLTIEGQSEPATHLRSPPNSKEFEGLKLTLMVDNPEHLYTPLSQEVFAGYYIAPNGSITAATLLAELYPTTPCPAIDPNDLCILSRTILEDTMLLETETEDLAYEIERQRIKAIDVDILFNELHAAKCRQGTYEH